MNVLISLLAIPFIIIIENIPAVIGVAVVAVIVRRLCKWFAKHPCDRGFADP